MATSFDKPISPRQSSFFVQWTNQMKDVISLTSKVSRRQGIDLSLEQQHPVKIFKAKKSCFINYKKFRLLKYATRWNVSLVPEKTPKQWDHIWLWSFKYRNGQPRKREQPKQTSKKKKYTPTVWQIWHFSVTQILREINFGECHILNCAILQLEGLWTFNLG